MSFPCQMIRIIRYWHGKGSRRTIRGIGTTTRSGTVFMVVSFQKGTGTWTMMEILILSGVMPGLRTWMAKEVNGQSMNPWSRTAATGRTYLAWHSEHGLKIWMEIMILTLYWQKRTPMMAEFSGLKTKTMLKHSYFIPFLPIQQSRISTLLFWLILTGMEIWMYPREGAPCHRRRISSLYGRISPGMLLNGKNIRSSKEKEFMKQ